MLAHTRLGMEPALVAQLDDGVNSVFQDALFNVIQQQLHSEKIGVIQDVNSDRLLTYSQCHPESFE